MDQHGGAFPGEEEKKKGGGRNLVQSVQYLARFFQGKYDEMRKKIKKEGDPNGEANEALTETRDQLLFESGLVSVVRVLDLSLMFFF